MIQAIYRPISVFRGTKHFIVDYKSCALSDTGISLLVTCFLFVTLHITYTVQHCIFLIQCNLSQTESCLWWKTCTDPRSFMQPARNGE